jgi:tetratricopeptide (TPR) repeat protein
MKNQPAILLDRVVRVFVSSTFRDMQAERDELVKRVFPQLRKLCEERGVTWGEVDLRWGITQEQSERGEVLPVCLAEIKRCRPYFIGLLGERYGWIPDAIPQELIEQEPWLSAYVDHSVTELEILHGVLNDPAMADHALFYFRDPLFIESLPADERSKYLELPAEEEIAKLGREEAERRTEGRREKLRALKDRIRASVPVREDYPSPQELGEIVLRDVTAIIERLYPVDEIPSELDRDAADHEAFALNRARVYIGRQEYFDRLNEHARADGPPLVVLGESGSGKSALLSTWAVRYRATDPNISLLMHFIGGGQHSADLTTMLRRIMSEFKRGFALDEEIPGKPEELRSAFAKWLHLAAARGKMVLILDGLNQLEGLDGLSALLWLPTAIPSNVRLIVSTLPGRSLDELNKRDWPTMRIEPLGTDERKRLIHDYLGQFSKQLSTDRIDRIAGADQAAKPLYLRAMLDELRIFGVHEELSARIEHYLAAPTVEKLYEKILERYEQDYDRERPGLVRESMSVLWAARRGLSEAELLELLGSEGEQLPHAIWSPLFLAAEPALAGGSGLLTFFHDYMRSAVRDRYLATSREQTEAHLRLANYFEATHPGSRRIDELPWHLAASESWQRLYELLADLQFLNDAWQANQFEVNGYWARIEERTPLRMLEAYRQVIENPSGLVNNSAEHRSAEAGSHVVASSDLSQYLLRQTDRDRRARQVWNVSQLLSYHGHLQETTILDEFLLSHFSESEFGWEEYSLALFNRARLFYREGNPETAMTLLKKQEELCQAVSRLGLTMPRLSHGLAACLGQQASILRDRGDLEGALALHRDQERICRQCNDKDILQSCLADMAMVLRAQGKLEIATTMLDGAEQLARELANKYVLARILGNRGAIELDHQKKMKFFREQEELCIEQGDRESLGICLHSQALACIDAGQGEAAIDLFKRREQLAREIRDHEGVWQSAAQQALMLEKRDGPGAAAELMRERLNYFRQFADRRGEGRVLIGLSEMLSRANDNEGALTAGSEGETVLSEVGDKRLLASCLSAKGAAAEALRDLGGAGASYSRAESLWRETGDLDGLQRSLAKHAKMLLRVGRVGQAAPLVAEHERVCRESGNKKGLQTSLGLQGKLAFTHGDNARALELFTEQEQLCRESGDKSELADAVGQRGLILFARDCPQEALTLLREAEQLSRELGNKRGLANWLGSQGLIVQAHENDPRLALALQTESEQLCRETKEVDGLAKALAMQAQLMVLLGNAREALPKAEEAIRLASAHGLSTLAEQMIRPILDYTRRYATNPGLPVESLIRPGLPPSEAMSRKQRYEPKTAQLAATRISVHRPLVIRARWALVSLIFAGFAVLLWLALTQWSIWGALFIVAPVCIVGAAALIQLLLDR